MIGWVDRQESDRLRGFGEMQTGKRQIERMRIQTDMQESDRSRGFRQTGRKAMDQEDSGGHAGK
jgi:hypothetical protein